MSTPVMRNGRLTSNALAGVDVTKLKSQDQHQLNDVLKKHASGANMTLDDLKTIMKARKAGGAKQDATETLSAKLGQLTQVLSK